MSDLADLIARTVNPRMSREEREKVYAVVRQAVSRLHGRADVDPNDPSVALQRHLVEETIRDIEADIARYSALERMREAREAQEAESAALSTRR